ncbi:MAG: hypothetical protein QM779_05735 [Propionicimonas sp.]|uniref:hypothetical protein n=1 Tax=Propionicimonas sp. TaxID=1955623 RepID=UPI003D0D52AB
MKVHPSALKHGVPAEDAIHAATHWAYASEPDQDSPARQLRLGFDTAGRLLEIIVLRFDSGNEVIIHAMKARNTYLSLLD